MVDQRILVPTDFSACAAAALQVADALAAAQQASLHVLHVHPVVEAAATASVTEFYSPQPPEQWPTLAKTLKQRLAEWILPLRTSAASVHLDVVVGSPVAEIVNRSSGYDLVVLGTHGRTGVSRFLLGSVTERVVRGAHCSVYVVKQKGAS